MYTHVNKKIPYHVPIHIFVFDLVEINEKNTKYCRFYSLNLDEYVTSKKKKKKGIHVYSISQKLQMTWGVQNSCFQVK